MVQALASNRKLVLLAGRRPALASISGRSYHLGLKVGM